MTTHSFACPPHRLRRTGTFFSWMHYDNFRPDIIVVGKAMQVCGLLVNDHCALDTWNARTFSEGERILRLWQLLSCFQPESMLEWDFKHIGDQHLTITERFEERYGVGNTWGCGYFRYIRTEAYDEVPVAAIGAFVFNSAAVRMILGYTTPAKFGSYIERVLKPKAAEESGRGGRRKGSKGGGNKKRGRR